MRLIDADVAVENIEEWLNSVGTALIGKGLSYTGELMGCIEDAQTVDAVPVVRCRDCKYYKEFRTKRNNQIMRLCYRMGKYDMEYFVNPNDFCSYGERKEDAG